ncbi:DsbA family protein [Candidatus Nomurabacteria bacterium]|nr:DsbA family protein [Candidatus Nomurabacteria bacterium]
MENKQKINTILSVFLLIALILIGIFLLKGKTPIPKNIVKNIKKELLPVSDQDFSTGNKDALLTIVMYEDFQCPFCGKFDKETEQPIRNTYVKDGKIQLVYRDFVFLGDESIKSAQAARCAGEQEKFWEYHDFLFTHQNGENKGAFADSNLKSFAKEIGLNEKKFNDCLDSGKYTKAILDSTEEGHNAGVKGTPKGFILKNGIIVDTINGAENTTTVFSKIEKALK